MNIANSIENSAPGMILRQPALRWEDALPCGNGLVGALVYGHIASERVALNHHDLWLRSPKPDLPDIADALPERPMAPDRIDVDPARCTPSIWLGNTLPHPGLAGWADGDLVRQVKKILHGAERKPVNCLRESIR